MGEYAQTAEELKHAFDTLMTNIGPLPLIVSSPTSSSTRGEEEKKSSSDISKTPKVITKTVILPDGSYGTETIVVDSQVKAAALAAMTSDT